MSHAPSFRSGYRLRFDAVRDAWIILAPERLFLLDGPAVEVLKLVDGARTLPAIVDTLATRYQASRETIAEDVSALLQDLADKGAIQL